MSFAVGRRLLCNYKRPLSITQKISCNSCLAEISNSNTKVANLSVDTRCGPGFTYPAAMLGSQLTEQTLSGLMKHLVLAPQNNLDIIAPSHSKNPTPSIGYLPYTSSKIVLDPTQTANLIGDPLSQDESVIGDNPEDMKQPEYKARHIQKLRRWHMNRHKLKKLRKRMRMVYRRRAFNVRKRKEARLQAEIQAIKQDGIEFDALKFVKERLERAKTGGFVQDIWKSNDEQPPVPWQEYHVSHRKLKSFERTVFIDPKFAPKLKKKNKK